LIPLDPSTIVAVPSRLRLKTDDVIVIKGDDWLIMNNDAPRNHCRSEFALKQRPTLLVCPAVERGVC
jgi:hypothetical protein